MKLLLDQNISRKILIPLNEKFPNSSQVFLENLHEADDKSIWNFARENGFIIVTKDSDFNELSILYGAPPKIIWLRCGNKNNQYILQSLISNHRLIEEFLSEANTICLEVY